jgi:hypothetical protein
MSYDVKCYELAKEFLDDVCNAASFDESDREHLYGQLAQRIQNTVEDYMGDYMPEWLSK